MKKLLLIAFAASVLCFTPLQAKAEDQDVAKISCKDFLADKGNMPMMIMWIDGYMSGKSDNTVMSQEWAEKLTMHLTQYCTKAPAKTIMDAINDMEG